MSSRESYDPSSIARGMVAWSEIYDYTRTRTYICAVTKKSLKQRRRFFPLLALIEFDLIFFFEDEYFGVNVEYFLISVACSLFSFAGKFRL